MRVILIFLIILGSMLQIRTSLSGPDTENYYTIARSLSFDRDLMFNEWPEFITITPTYHILEQHQIGASLVWMLIVDLLKSMGFANEHNLGLIINLTEYLLGILSLFFIFRICLKFFDRQTAFWSILAFLWGTNLWAYITVLSGASHISAIFFTSGFLLFYFNTRQERSLADWLILGGLAGLMLMARGDTGLYLIFPAFDLLRYIKNKNLKRILISGSIFILGLLFTFSPQLLFWKIIFGKIFRPLGEYDYYAGNKFLEALFSPSRGFFFFSPLLGLCFLIGLIYLYKKEKTLAVSTAIIFLALVYGIGRQKFFFCGGDSFGARYFLVFLPLFILSVAGCFERLSLKNRMIITVISGMWSFLLFLLFISGKGLDFYKSKIFALDFSFFYDILQGVYKSFKNIILKFTFLKSIFLIALSLVIWLLGELFKRIKIPKIPLKRISIFLVSGIIIYIHIIFVECYFNDQKLISQLQKEGFYKDAIFGEFDKVDVAGIYLYYAEGQIKNGRIVLAIETIKRAMRLYPPYQEDAFEYFYKIHMNYPASFNTEFLKSADAFDCLGLSLKFYEKGDFTKAKYYFQEAVRLKPDIIEAVKEEKDSYLNIRLNKALDFFNRIGLRHD